MGNTSGSPTVALPTEKGIDSPRRSVGSPDVGQPFAISTTEFHVQPTEACQATPSVTDFFDLEVESAMASTVAAAASPGHYATVYRGRHRRNNQPVAIKKIRRALTDEVRLKQSEVAALRKIQKHPHIVTLLDVFETAGDVYVVMELCTGGELFERLAEKGPYSEMDCMRHIRSMAEAVAYMHANDIVHRDLKPENILLSTPDDTLATIKIADFGLAKITTVSSMKTKCGTWGYSAPEMISGSGCAFGYDAKVDSWSLGTILYILYPADTRLCGFHPFDPHGTRSDNEMIAAIKKCQFDFEDEAATRWSTEAHGDAWVGISAQAKDLIRHLLVLDPTERYSMQDVLGHLWLTGVEGVDIPVQPLSPTIHTDLGRYQKSSKQKMYDYED
ncbi:calcium/calmodulin-dependent protein kinase [Achlya hypogyna]|uniref:Calcium/calmodulin-dependent protein kinase n=1 Tax=Achlya hypogyna TaxID=1202772 RepID=A0A1V9ZFQ2_ACHHY|nr:calcium/calmodulin-dependent protein kinase [Achlya hypogyna]